tara:strand:+ start:272 stop:655 length:384 start_codon:yes stop_codon:yes gene_type:complete
MANYARISMVRKNAKDAESATRADLDAFKADILNLLSNISKTGTAPAENGADEDAQAMEYAKKNNLIVYEIVGYSFRSSDGKTPDMKSLKTEMQNIYGCKALQEASGVNTGSSIVMSVFPVEVKKVE